MKTVIITFHEDMYMYLLKLGGFNCDAVLLNVKFHLNVCPSETCIWRFQ